MANPPIKPRTVFVLGRKSSLDIEPVARRVADEGGQLVLLSLGLRVTSAQERVVWEALRLAGQLPLWIDAVLVPTIEEIAGYVQPEDVVEIIASGRERKRLERALRVRSHRVGTGRRARPIRASDDDSAPTPPSNGHAGGSAGRNHLVLAGVVERGPASWRSLAKEPGAARTPSGGNEAKDQSHPDRQGGEAMPTSESVEALAGREIPVPVAESAWSREEAETRKRGVLRVYLGAAPGVGKTYAMLSEGQRRRSRGTDVVVGVVHTYQRPKTIEMLQGLEVIPPRKIEYRGTTFDELGPDAVIARRPEVALIDELAHTNIPGSRRAKRWEDVLDILAEGITVITTLNVQHLTSVNDVVAEVTGIRQQETVPDWILDLADDVELVDMSPHALQRRMIHGNVYPDSRKAELALRRFFTTENLTALRELALMRVANQVDEALLARWSKRRTPETRERILVCVSRPNVSEDLIRRGGRIAQRTQGDLLVIHVDMGESRSDPRLLEDTRRLVADVGGEFQVLAGEDPVETVLAFAYQQHVTQILVGESARSRWQELLRGSFVNRLIRKASNIDVHVIARRER